MAVYAGELEGFNRGNAAMAAIDAENRRSFRNYLANVASNRTRENLGTRELALREALGNQDLTLRGELGRGELSLGRDRLTQEESNRATRERLGMRGIDVEAQNAKLMADTRLKEIEAEVGIKNKELDALQRYYQAGGGTDPRVAIEIQRRNEELRLLLAQAQNAAAIANSAIEEGIKKKGREWFTRESTAREGFMSGVPEYRDEIVGGARQAVGEDAYLVDFDPNTRSFVPSATLFPRAQPMGVPQATVPMSGTNMPPTRLFDRYQQFLRR